MERHIFKFGSNSVALIVPKRWLDKNGLKPSSTVYVSESESGNLIVSAAETAKREAEKVVTSKTRPSFISRWVGLHYMYGTGRLRVYSADGLTQAQVDGIEAKINVECPGFEITSQSSNDLVMEDLTDIREIDLDRIISRLRSLINQEFVEFISGDQKSVPKIERLVNRFYMLGMRYVNITQAKDALMYFGVLEMLEAISDKLEVVSVGTAIKNKQVFEELRAAFALCPDAMAGDSEALEKVAQMREEIIRKLPHRTKDDTQTKMLREVIDSISSIAEFGLRFEDVSNK